MKIAILSDIHSNLIALQEGLGYLKDQNIDDYVFLGDYITDGYRDNEVIDLIKKVATHSISGNRDRITMSSLSYPVAINFKPQEWTLNHLNEPSVKFLNQLPTQKIVEYNGIRFLFIHGDNPTIRKPLEHTFDELIKLESFDVCVMGHIHRHFDRNYRGRRFINASSLGLPADGPDYKFLIVDITNKVEVDIISLPTIDTFETLSSEYHNSSYFQKHEEWGTIVLDSILYGVSGQDIFFKIVKNMLDKNPTLTINDVWSQAFEIYVSTNPTTYKRLNKRG